MQCFLDKTKLYLCLGRRMLEGPFLTAQVEPSPAVNFCKRFTFAIYGTILHFMSASLCDYQSRQTPQDSDSFSSGVTFLTVEQDSKMKLSNNRISTNKICKTVQCQLQLQKRQLSPLKKLISCFFYFEEDKFISLCYSVSLTFLKDYLVSGRENILVDYSEDVTGGELL